MSCVQAAQIGVCGEINAELPVEKLVDTFFILCYTEKVTNFEFLYNLEGEEQWVRKN